MNASLAAAIALVGIPATPLVLALLWALPRLRPLARALVPWAALPALVAVFLVEPGSQVRLAWLLFGSVFGLDELRRVFLAFTALLWLAAGLHARGALRGDAHAARFDLLWLLTMTGNFGLILAHDVATFYTSFALMTFAAYGLVIHDGSAPALRAGRVYLVMAVLGEALILTGLVLAARASAAPLAPMLAHLPAAIAHAAQRDLVIACLWLGFGIKAGLPLLHMWLPLAHPVAPIPASAVLSGAMIKAGLFGWLATLPLGHASLPQWSTLVIAAGFAAAFGAALVGIHQRTPKTVLAYSSVSQMGLMTVGVGGAFHAPELALALVPAVALYAMHHGLAKGALFLGVSLARHPGRRARTLLWLALALPGLSLAGLMTSGIVAKLALKNGLAAGGLAVPGWWAHLPWLLALAALGTTALVARYLWLLRDADRGDCAPASMWLGWGLLLAAGTVGILFLLPLLPRGMGDIAPPALSELATLAAPVLAGAALSVVAWRWLRAWPLPAGDVLAWLVPIPALGMRAVRWVGAAVEALAAPLRRRHAAIRRPHEHAQRRATVIERLWRREAALAFALLLVAMLLASLGLP